MAAENAEMRRRIESGDARGRDAKELTPEIEEARTQVRRKSLMDKEAMERRLREENAEQKRASPRR